MSTEATPAHLNEQRNERRFWLLALAIFLLTLTSFPYSILNFVLIPYAFFLGVKTLSSSRSSGTDKFSRALVIVMMVFQLISFLGVATAVSQLPAEIEHHSCLQEAVTEQAKQECVDSYWANN